MRANNLGPRGMEVLAPGLIANCSLRRIDLGDNDWCLETEVKPGTLTLVQASPPSSAEAGIPVGATVMYTRSRECDAEDNVAKLSTASPAVKVEEEDRQGDVKIVMLNGAHALADVVRQNTSLAELR